MQFPSNSVMEYEKCCPSAEDFNDDHLAPLCPPSVCHKCSLDQCAAINCSSSHWEPKEKKPNHCANRYQILKHVIKCPPKCKTKSACGIRSNYKPVKTCSLVDPCAMMCYETSYMRSFTSKN